MKPLTPPAFFITGASGFISSCLCRHLADRYYVTGAYYSTPVTPAGCTMIMFDISDRKKVRLAVENIRATHITHAAALSTPDMCENDPQTA